MLCSLLRDLRYCLTQGSSHKAASLTHGNETHMLSLDGGPVCHIHIGAITSKLKEMGYFMYTGNDENCAKIFPQYHTNLLYTRL